MSSSDLAGGDPVPGDSTPPPNGAPSPDDGLPPDDAVPPNGALAPNGAAPGSVAGALAMAGAGLNYLFGAAVGGELAAPGIGEVLVSVAGLQARLTAVQAELLRRFDAAGAHTADGYGSSAAWLAAKTQMTRRDAKAAMRETRQLAEHRDVHAAMSGGEISKSLGLAIAEWTRKLPGDLRAQTGKILLEAAAAGASPDDLAVLAAAAYEKWRQQHPDEDGERGFRDRYVRLGTTFGGAAFLDGGLTPECAASVRAVLEALGKRQGPEDERSDRQRFHDALQEACQLLIRARMVPDRAGADTQVTAHVPLSSLREMPGAGELEQAWLNARLGRDGYLTGTDAQTAACDATIIPVVTGHADMTVIDEIITLVLAVGHGTPGDGTADGGNLDGLTPTAEHNLRYAVARLALDFVSGPSGIAGYLRTGLLQPPFATPSLPLDIGYAQSVPAHIRRAVRLRDRHCAWPGCHRPAAACDVHHIRHQQDGGETSLGNCLLLCQFHHDICVHRWGWQIILHPDGTTSAYGPRGQVLHSQALHSQALHSRVPPGHAPPDTCAA